MNGMAGSSVAIDTPSGDVSIELPIPGLYNVYNAVAAAAAACALKLPVEAISGGLRAARAVFGRVETISVGGHDVALLLIKNPTGANEVLRTITAQSGRFDLWIALNDNIADGRDVSWVWDADFEELAGRVNRVTCSGTRAPELALRLAYAGVDRHDISVDGRIEHSFDAAVSAAAAADTPIYALPTYTSLLELRTAIAKRGEAPAYWSK
jgi:UDP-N-acetylmuramyl tripeptide synthase